MKLICILFSIAGLLAIQNPASAETYQCEDFVITEEPWLHQNCINIRTQKPYEKPGQIKSQFTSEGLGISMKQWESIYGSPESECVSSYLCYQQNSYMIVYFNKNVGVIDKTLKSGVSIKQSRKISKAYIPSDSQYVKTYKAPYSESIVDLYYSPSLKTRFSSNWTNGKPGDFIVLHGGGESISRIIIGIGNNP